MIESALERLAHTTVLLFAHYTAPLFRFPCHSVPAELPLCVRLSCLSLVCLSLCACAAVLPSARLIATLKKPKVQSPMARTKETSLPRLRAKLARYILHIELGCEESHIP